MSNRNLYSSRRVFTIMNRILITLVALVSVAHCLTLMTYNIRTGIGMDNIGNLSRIADVINSLNPDLIGLQEVDRYTQRNNEDQPSILGNMTSRYSYFIKNRDYQGGDYGVAVLSKYKPIEIREFHYHPPHGNPGKCVYPSPIPNDYCQGALAIKVQVDGGATIWFITTHIGLGGMASDEVSQLVDEFVPTLSPCDAVFVTGDFNSVPTENAIKIMINHNYLDTWAMYGDGDGYTFDSAHPYERIDYVFQLPPRYKNSKIFMPQTLASDHLPVVAWYNVK